MLPEVIAQPARRSIGILRKQRNAVVIGNIGAVHAGIGANQPVGRFGNNHTLIHAHDTMGLSQDNFDESGVSTALRSQTAGESRGLDIAETDQASF